MLLEFHLRDTLPITAEQQALLEWVWSDPPETPLNHFFLRNEDGRKAFFQELYARGYSALFEAVAHVWTSLEEPREYRCMLIGAACGTGGSGKTALMRALNQFVTDALAVDNPLPARADFGSLAEWHSAVTESFEADHKCIERLVNGYAMLLDGRILPTDQTP